MTRPAIAVLALLCCVALAFGCQGDDDDDDDQVQSTQPPACPSIAVSAFLPRRIESAPVRIEGVAGTTDHMAIQAILVGPVAATRDGFNFSRWSASLDADQLTSLPLPGDELDVVILPLRAIDHRGVICDPSGDDPEVTIALPTEDPEPPGRDAGSLDGG